MVFDWAEVTSRARIAANRVNPRRVFVAGIVRPHVCLLSSHPRLYVGSSSMAMVVGGWMGEEAWRYGWARVAFDRDQLRLISRLDAPRSLDQRYFATRATRCLLVPG